MAKQHEQKHKGERRAGHDRDHDHDERHRDGDRENHGDDPRRHARIIGRRWEGSAPPTSERYARALRQWNALPGAVVLPATAVGGGSKAPAAGDRAGAASDESRS